MNEKLGGKENGRTDDSDRGGRPGHPGRCAHPAVRGRLSYSGSGKRPAGIGTVQPGGGSCHSGHHDAGHEWPARV